jgi:hypothetical protein
MISLANKLRATFSFVILPLSLGLTWSCKDPTSGIREELVRSLKGEDVTGFDFAIEEDENQTVASLTNSAVRDLIRLDDSKTNVVLKYTLVKEKKANAAKTYRTEVVKTGTDLTIGVTDVATSRVVSKMKFPEPEPHHEPDRPPLFDTLEECIADFYCTTAPALQCEANRTCKDQFAALTCCLKSGQCFSVHLIIRPTSFKCRLSVLLPDFGVFVLSRG